MISPVLCPREQCTGCEACKNSCPVDCIQMIADDEGFLQPEINDAICIGCKKCEKSCPVLHKPQPDTLADPEVYACWHKNEAIRMNSSSGGAFTALAESVLNQGGVVFGAAYDKNMHVHHIGIENLNDLDKLRRSKYVQSEIADTFRQAKNYLDKGRQVLFVGTPCQIAGLNSFLGRTYDNLLSVDLICGGVPSPKVLEQYKHQIDKDCEITLTAIDFRDKRHGWENNSVIGYCANGKELHLKGRNNSYFTGYILHMFLRTSCYRCPAQGKNRPGDLTISDFWGIEKDDVINQNEIDRGISALIINRIDKKHMIIPELEKRMKLYSKTFQDVLPGNKVMYNSPEMPPARGEFFTTLNKNGYAFAASEYLQYSNKRKVIQFIKENLGVNNLAKLRKIKQQLGI